jgi:hypothetical protein
MCWVLALHKEEQRVNFPEWPVGKSDIYMRTHTHTSKFANHEARRPRQLQSHPQQALRSVYRHIQDTAYIALPCSLPLHMQIPRHVAGKSSGKPGSNPNRLLAGLTLRILQSLVMNDGMVWIRLFNSLAASLNLRLSSGCRLNCLLLRSVLFCAILSSISSGNSGYFVLIFSSSVDFHAAICIVFLKFSTAFSICYSVFRGTFSCK